MRSVLSEPQLDVTYEHLPPRAPSVRALRGGVFARPVRPAGGFRGAVHPVPYLQASAPRCAPPGSICSTGDLTDEQLEAVKKHAHQPR